MKGLRLGPTVSDDSVHIIYGKYNVTIHTKSVLRAETVVINPRTLELLIGLIHSYHTKASKGPA